MSGIRPPNQPGQPGNTAARSTVPPRATHETYHPDGYGTSEGLKRARKPFAARNAVTGGAILAFAVGVYYYSISKVSKPPHPFLYKTLSDNLPLTPSIRSSKTTSPTWVPVPTTKHTAPPRTSNQAPRMHRTSSPTSRTTLKTSFTT